MAVGKLNVTPVTVRGLSAPGLDGAKLFVGCFIQETEKHRTHSENGPEPYWKNTLTCTVPEGQNFLHIELVNENPNNGGIVATSKVALNQVFDQGNETKWAQLNSSSGQSYGEIKLELSFNGTNSVSSVTSSFGSMSMAGGQQASYQQTTTHSQTSTHSSSQSESRQGSFASLGPANPIPSNYGSGTPPPFTPPAAVSYPEKSGNNTMPGSAAYGGMPVAGGLLAGGDHQKTTTINTENMTKEQFEEAKAKGSIPTWMKYGGGVLAGAAALGLTAWGAHELKEHFDHKKEEEEKLQHQTSSPVSYGSQQQHGQPQQQPYAIHNQQGQSQQYPHPPPPVQQHHSSAAEKSHCEKKDKKEHKKKDKHHKKRGSGSDSSSSSSDSSDSSDSEDEHKKKDKHHKKRDSDWH